MLTLYHFTGATCAAKVLLSLSEKGIDFEDRLLTRADLATPEYRALNPAGVVPTIVHDGAVIIESSVILNYIEDAMDGPSLRPADAKRRAEMNLWLRRLDDVLINLGTMTYAIAARFEYLAKSAEEREAYYAGIPNPLIRQSRRNAIELGVDAPEAADAVNQLIMLQKQADEALKGQSFLVHGDFSLADISLIPFVHRLDALGLLATPEQLPDFHRWWDAVRARPSFATAIASRIPEALTQRLRDASAQNAERLEQLKADALAA